MGATKRLRSLAVQRRGDEDRQAGFDFKVARLRLLSTVFDESNVRYVLKNGSLWFLVRDVCQALGLASHEKHAARLEPKHRAKIPIRDFSDREFPQVFAHHEGVFSIIMRARSGNDKAARLQGRILKLLVQHDIHGHTSEVIRETPAGLKVINPGQPALPQSAPAFQGLLVAELKDQISSEFNARNFPRAEFPKSTRDKVRKLSGDSCIRCYVPLDGKGHFHHIAQRDVNHILNCMLLCRPCHDWLHGGGGWKECEWDLLVFAWKNEIRRRCT